VACCPHTKPYVFFFSRVPFSLFLPNLFFFLFEKFLLFFGPLHRTGPSSSQLAPKGQGSLPLHPHSPAPPFPARCPPPFRNHRDEFRFFHLHSFVFLSPFKQQWAEGRLVFRLFFTFQRVCVSTSPPLFKGSFFKSSPPACTRFCVFFQCGSRCFLPPQFAACSTRFKLGA